MHSNEVPQRGGAHRPSGAAEELPKTSPSRAKKAAEPIDRSGPRTFRKKKGDQTPRLGDGWTVPGYPVDAMFRVLTPASPPPFIVYV